MKSVEAVINNRLSCFTLLAWLVVAAPTHAQERPSDFVDAANIIEDLVVDMRYYGEDNFVGERIDGYLKPRCLLTEQAATALAKVQDDLATRGLGLKVFDCYRPTRAVKHFVRWAQDLDATENKTRFYPDVEKRDLFKLGYIAEQSSHSRGSTIDVTLVRLKESSELDMGTPYDFFGKESWPNNNSITPEQYRNRMLLRKVMTNHGFKPLQEEWWHFTLANEAYPDTYFDFPVQ